MSLIKPILSSQQEDGADAAGTEAVDAIGQFVVDVGGGHHGFVAFGPGSVGDSVEEPPPAFLEDPAVVFSGTPAAALWSFLRRVALTRKPPLFGIVRMCSLPPLFQNLWGFSSVF